jgi:hypothetical protein
VKSKLRILLLEGILADIDMDFKSFGYVTGNYNSSRNLKRLKTLKKEQSFSV